MADEHIGHAELTAEIGQQVEDRRADDGIQRRGNFVAENQVRLGCQRARQVHALLLAAREFAAAPLREPGGKAHQIEKLRDARVGRLALEVVIEAQRAREYAADRMRGIERRIGILENDLDAPELFAGAFAQHRGKRRAIEHYRAARGRHQPGDHARERGFSGTRFTDDADGHTTVDRQVDFVQHPRGRQAIRDGWTVAGDQPANFQQWRRLFFCRCRRRQLAHLGCRRR